MVNPKDIKEQIKPTDIALKYLGKPDKTRYGKLWYKSPFRSERTASFMVDEKSFHDFGDSWDGDIFGFIKRYYSVDFKEAVKIIQTDFGIIDSNWQSKDLKRYLKQTREQHKQAEEGLNKWFDNELQAIIKAQSEWVEIAKHSTKDILELAYNEISRLEYLWEVFSEAIGNKDKKLQIYRDMKKTQ